MRKGDRAGSDVKDRARAPFLTMLNSGHLSEPQAEAAGLTERPGWGATGIPTAFQAVVLDVIAWEARLKAETTG